VPCSTVDRRHPDAEVHRREAGQRSLPRIIQSKSPQSVRTSTSDSNPRVDEVEATPYAADELTSEDTNPQQSSINRFQGSLPIFEARQHNSRDSAETLIRWLNLALYR